MIVTHLKTKLPTRLHERDILQICTDQLFLQSQLYMPVFTYLVHLLRVNKQTLVQMIQELIIFHECLCRHSDIEGDTDHYYW
jgi:hypothetical protein